MLFIALILFFFGICFGSFVNALIWRIHEQSATKSKKKREKLSIVHGRSMCVRCGHELSALDLVPVFSWLALRGKCRYCGKKIDDNPLVEVIAGLIFAFSYLLWPTNLHSAAQWLALGTWLACSAGLLALAVYDLKWMLLPSRILYPTVVVAWVGQLANIALYGTNRLHQLELFALSIVIASGVFWLLYVASKGKWIGFGDVRLGLITGALLLTPEKSFIMIFLASLLGTIAVIPLIAMGRKGLSAKIPYGPYLIASTFIVLLFGDSLIRLYDHVLKLQ